MIKQLKTHLVYKPPHKSQASSFFLHDLTCIQRLYNKQQLYSASPWKKGPIVADMAIWSYFWGPNPEIKKNSTFQILICQDLRFFFIFFFLLPVGTHFLFLCLSSYCLLLTSPFFFKLVIPFSSSVSLAISEPHAHTCFLLFLLYVIVVSVFMQTFTVVICVFVSMLLVAIHRGVCLFIIIIFIIIISLCNECLVFWSLLVIGLNFLNP